MIVTNVYLQTQAKDWEIFSHRFKQKTRNILLLIQAKEREMFTYRFKQNTQKCLPIDSGINSTSIYAWSQISKGLQFICRPKYNPDEILRIDSSIIPTNFNYRLKNNIKQCLQL